MKPPRDITWHAYPALLFSGCFAAGITIASLTHFLPLYLWIASTVIAGGLTASSWILKPANFQFPRRLYWTIGLFLIGICIGSVRHDTRRALPSNHLFELSRQIPEIENSRPVLVRGRIVSFPRMTSKYIRFTLAADTLLIGLQAFSVTGKLQVILWKPFIPEDRSYPSVTFQQHVLIAAPLREILPRGNPADFDYKSYMARRGIHFTLSVSNPIHVTALQYDPSPFASLLTKIRAHVLGSITTNIPSPQAQAILLALLVGDRSQLASDVKQQFQHTGLMHLLAISGLHVMIIGLVFYNLLLPLLKRLRFSWRVTEWIRSIVTMAILLTYCLITGAPPSVVRALVMTTLVLGGVLAQRTYHPLNALGAAAIFLLALNPDQLFDVGFQLSFSAVGGILTITPTLNRASPASLYQHRALYYLMNTLYASVAATLAAMPVTLYHFGQVAFGGLILNLLAIPITAVILSGAVTTVLFHGANALIAAYIGVTTDRAVHALLLVASLGEQVFDWTLLEESVRSPSLLIPLITGLLVLVQWHRPRLRWRIATLSLLVLTAHVWIQAVKKLGNDSLEVIFFDVGQGDAAIVQLPSNRYILIDGGNRSSFTDEGARTILPHLRHFGIDGLEAAIVSHAHRDHMGGLLTVIRQIPVRRVVYNGHQYSSHLFDEMIEAADSLGLPLQTVTAGDTLDIDPRVRMQILAPLQTPTTEADANEASIILRIIYRDIVFLFTGDIERHTEQRLVNNLSPLLPADVIKAPHHGSQTSSTLPFVHQTTSSPDDIHTVIISVGRNNKFGLPDPPVIDRWYSVGARVEFTTHGAVWLRTDGHHLERVRWK